MPTKRVSKAVANRAEEEPVEERAAELEAGKAEIQFHREILPEATSNTPAEELDAFFRIFTSNAIEVDGEGKQRRMAASARKNEVDDPAAWEGLHESNTDLRHPHADRGSVKVVHGKHGSFVVVQVERVPSKYDPTQSNYYLTRYLVCPTEEAAFDLVVGYNRRKRALIRAEKAEAGIQRDTEPVEDPDEDVFEV